MDSPGQTPPLLLLVEDHVDTSRALTLLLEQAGYDVRAAANGSEALQLLDQCRFDAVISDIGLPDTTGCELMQHISQRYKLPGIAVSGSHPDDIADDLARAGFVAHLMKPIDFDGLQAALDRLRA